MVTHADWGALREAETQRMLAACTRCGKCAEVCPMIAYAPDAAGVAARELVIGVLDVLRGGEGSAAARGWIGACQRSGVCNDACPEAVDPMLMLRLAKWRANETGALPKRDASDAMARVKAFARLGFTDREQEDWL
jgi:Fe-S oxidoreductase